MKKIRVPLETDESGLVGRKCPTDSHCLRYFKISPGPDSGNPDQLCICPYCGHQASRDQFFTQDQIKRVESAAFRDIAIPALEDMQRTLAESVRGHKNITFKPGRMQATLHRYAEEDLETEVVCNGCTFRYAIYGVFAFCPDCGQHNSQQILNKSLDVVEKMLAMAKDADTDVAEKMKENALEDVVSAFDGFGREVCRVHASAASDSAKAEKISFQDLIRAEETLRRQFGFDLADCLQIDDWQFVKRSFQKRHPFTHRMGVVDDKYIAKADDPHAVAGRKVVVTVDDILKLVGLVRLLGQSLYSHFSGGGGE